MRLSAGVMAYPRNEWTDVEDVWDCLVVWDVIGLALFNKRFEFGKRQSASFLPGFHLVQLVGLMDEIGIETQCIFQRERIPSDSAKFQIQSEKPECDTGSGKATESRTEK
jgi:hypothetical protein